jgi:hypothetical protein
VLFHEQFLHTWKMADLKNQNFYIKFCLKLGKKSTETFDTLPAPLGDRQWKKQKFLDGFPSLNAVIPRGHVIQ